MVISTLTGAVAGGICLLFIVGAYLVGRKVGQISPSERSDLLAQIKRLESSYDSLYEIRKKDFETIHELQVVQANLQKMLKSREVKWPQEKQKITSAVVWERRKFASHPEVNLKNLSEEIQLYHGKEVHLKVSLTPSAAWKHRSQHPIRDLFWRGPAERMVEDLRSILRDPSYGFTATLPPNATEPEPRFVWKTDSAVVVFDVTLTVYETTEVPNVHYVEVPVYEIKVVEVDRIPPRESSPTPDPAPVAPLDMDKIAALVEVMVDTRLAQRSGRLPKQDLAPNTPHGTSKELEPVP